MNTESLQKVVDLYRRVFGEEPSGSRLIPGAGSARQYYRLTGKEIPVIGVFNPEIRENEAFLSFTRVFRELGYPVPEILGQHDDNSCYLLEDLGDQTLFSLILKEKESGQLKNKEDGTAKGEAAFPAGVADVYRQVVKWLPRFQVSAGTRIDYTKCTPRPVFDAQSMMWDLNYFKYYYLKLAGIPFDEQQLENDFGSFTQFLSGVPSEHFMYRDFQSRNIMIREGSPWFIDYQGGRKGALQYDLASLLYDAKADIPVYFREELTSEYQDALSGLISYDRGEFLRYLPGFSLIRILQAFGAYGFRGYYQGKSHFLQSVPFALNNISGLIGCSFLNELPELRKVIERMILSGTPVVPAGLPDTVKIPSRVQVEKIQTGPEIKAARPGPLVVRICSFSYKDGIPEDQSGNGGGFVFDCRALPNPGRYKEYQSYTGKDRPVIVFLAGNPEVDAFLDLAVSLVRHSVITYSERGFTNLMVSFGCTGGQHRSVYCAEKATGKLSAMFTGEQYRITLEHQALDRKAGLQGNP